MSGALPAKMTVVQGGIAPAIAIEPARAGAPPPGVPPYPLNTDPDVPWTLVWQDGVLTWVPWMSPATAAMLGLEGAAGTILLEDGDGVMLMETSR